MYRLLALVLLGLVALIFFIVQTKRRLSEAPTQPAEPEADWRDDVEELPARFRTGESVDAPDFSSRAATPQFQAAVAEATELLGSPPGPLRPWPDTGLNVLHPEVEIPGGVSFKVPWDRARTSLPAAQARLRERGYVLFRIRGAMGIGGQPDFIGLLPTPDPYEVIAAMRTNGGNYGVGTADVIAWMKALHAEQPLVITGVGPDRLEGRFLQPVRDADALAARMYAFCPDTVDQGLETLDALARHLEESNSLYFWWD